MNPRSMSVSLGPKPPRGEDIPLDPGEPTRERAQLAERSARLAEERAGHAEERAGHAEAEIARLRAELARAGK